MTTSQQQLVGTCPIAVDRASMVMRWDKLTFMHWRVEPAVVQAMLPAGLTVETFDGSAWVGLIPFVMDVHPPHVPSVPWLSHFCETNVRTYVTAADGTNGVWFLSLEAARLAAVVAARTTYRLPYFWAEMEYDRADDIATYSSRRRWPGPVGASSHTRVRIGDEYRPDELTQLDHFLTARWRLYSHSRSGVRSALAEHEPWPLHRAEVLDLDDQLVVAAGFPAPTEPPIVHWSPGVEVRIGMPHRLRT